MLQKILYIVGGIIGAFVLIGAVLPNPPASVELQVPAIVEADGEGEEEGETSEQESALSAAVGKAYSVMRVVDGDTFSISIEGRSETVRKVFGELAACKIAHSQTLRKNISEQDLDRNYRSEQALTTGLMELLAEESVIAHRLKRLGQKKPIHSPEDSGKRANEKINH